MRRACSARIRVETWPWWPLGRSFGLAGYFCTRDLSRAFRFAKRYAKKAPQPPHQLSSDDGDWVWVPRLMAYAPQVFSHFSRFFFTRACSDSNVAWWVSMKACFLLLSHPLAALRKVVLDEKAHRWELPNTWKPSTFFSTPKMTALDTEEAARTSTLRRKGAGYDTLDDAI